MKVSLVWVTPDGDNLIAHIARVSNPDNQDNKATAPKLIRYMIDHKHWSPFEQVNANVKINAPRDITRQLLRHRSFSFQEFSGRYADYESLYKTREGRLQDHKNRQSSLDIGDQAVRDEWLQAVTDVRDFVWSRYRAMRDAGIAKEVARVLLPEGLVPTTIYVNGTLRSWIHYWDVRCTPETQKEHREMAEMTRSVILPAFPEIAKALNDHHSRSESKAYGACDLVARPDSEPYSSTPPTFETRPGC
jgi:thymidylate synthase (FAD)